MEKEMGFDLPEEIITSILCWLPVRSLVRISCVSKRWHFIIISDQQFAKSHLQLALQRRTLTHRLFLTRCPPRLHSWENVDSFDGSVMELTIPAAECVGHKIAHYGLGSKRYTDEVIVLTSCNGLVLLGHWRYCECLSIWNPSTGFFRRVPSPRIIIGNREIDESLKCTVSAFGYVSSTDDYKIVLVVPHRGIHVFIFSLRANCWRDIEAPHSSSDDPHCHVGALFNGALHWINHRFGFSEPATLHAFDLAEEEFREFSLPVCFQFPFENYTFISVLSGGCLYVCCSGLYDDNSGEIWGMTQYAVSESWVKLFEIRPADLPDVFHWNYYNWNVCFVTEDGKLVIRVCETNELVKFESRKEEELVELICIGRYLLPGVPEFTDTQYGCDLYAETLISVPV